jgi:gluconate 2-dehydrogenase gamma chain
VASNEAARLSGPGAPSPRRQVFAGYRFLSPHQAAVLYAATRQLISGAGWQTPELVVAYVDRLLSIFDAQPFALRVRAADLRDQYSDGIALLDELADGDFTALARLRQNIVLSHTRVMPLVGLLFDHIVAAIDASPATLRCGALDRYHETG